MEPHLTGSKLSIYYDEFLVDLACHCVYLFCSHCRFTELAVSFSTWLMSTDHTLPNYGHGSITLAVVKSHEATVE